MRNILLLASAAVALAVSGAVPSYGGETATRCGPNGCDRIHCDETGDRCVRYSQYDPRYNGYYNSYNNDRGYGYYGGEYGPPDQGYYGGYTPAYNGYYGEHLVCDGDGDRCYHSSEPYWNYREYYRIHGYHWDDRNGW